MDDITTMTCKQIGVRWILRRLETLCTWGRLTFKSKKSRSLVIKKGKVIQARFKVQGETIPTISDSPIKALGKLFDDSLCHSSEPKNIMDQLLKWLNSIDNTPLPGNLKAWCFQFGIIPRLTWPFSLYCFPPSSVEAMEKKCSKFLRSWFGVSRSFSDVNLYSKTSPAALPISSVVEEFKVCQVRSALLLSQSKDHVARSTSIGIPTGKKWSANNAIQDANCSLRIKDVVGTIARGKLGLGHYGNKQWSTAEPIDKRRMVIAEVKKQEEDLRHVKAVSLVSQGAWVNWEGIERRPTSLGDLLCKPESSLSFFLRAVSDTLPSNTNLVRWGKLDDPTCLLCQTRPATLNHVLSSCHKALSEGRYTWRHNKVLRVIGNELNSLISEEIKVRSPQLQQMDFVREGTAIGRLKKPKPSNKGLLFEANDWQLQLDLDSKVVFPQELVVTNLRPDVILMSMSRKIIVLLELTVPWEERVSLSHEIKFGKYEHLLIEARQKGWRASCYPIEIGCRGFVSKSLSYMWRCLGLNSSRIKKVNSRLARETEMCSRWLWLKRNADWLSY